MRKFMLLFLWVFPLLGWSQDTGTISGNVADSDTGDPLPDVSVSIQGTDYHTLTKSDGTFELTGIPAGKYNLRFYKDKYEIAYMPVTLPAGKNLNVGTILLWTSTGNTDEIGVINLNEQELQSDDESAENVSGILQSGMDAFSRAASFQFSNARFSPRGLDAKYSTVWINGIPVNQLYDGRPQWSSWGGLNDVMRAREMYPNLSPSDYDASGLLGGVNYNLKASDIRKTTKVSYASTNRSYRHRVMATYASGMQKNGWAYALLFSGRYANEGYFEGTYYDAKSLFGAVEKKINDHHSLNLTFFMTPNFRGKSSPNTMEAYDLKGERYNAYWGIQADKKRNARRKKLFAPSVILTHNWDIDQNTSLETSLAYRKQITGNSRIGYYDANNPDPTYYRYLPSYWLAKDNLSEAANHYLKFVQYGQIDWDYLYRANKTNTADDGSARYYYYDDRLDENNFYFSSVFSKRISDALNVNAGVHVLQDNAEGYAYMNDLLGAQFFYDKNPYATPGMEDNDANNPDRKVKEKDKFSYDYLINGLKARGFVQAQYYSKALDIYGAASFGITDYQRNGLYKNPLFADSYGKSNMLKFNEYVVKAGATFKLTGRHLLNANFLMQNKAPDMRNIFYNGRVSNDVTPGLSDESIHGFDLSYIYRSPYIKSRLTFYVNQIDRSTEIQRFFAQGISLNGVSGIPGNINGNAFFLTQIVSGASKLYEGLEYGLEAQLSPTWKATFALALGKHVYTNNPDVYVASDLFDATYLGKSNLTGYRLANGPQTAAGIGIEYRSPHYWFAGLNFNWFDNNYIGISPILRTDRFYLDPNTNEPYGDIENYRGVDKWDIPAVNNEILSSLLKQEKLPSYTHLNFIGGKSWKIKKYYIGLFVLVNNIMDNVQPTGGFEQSRKASYPELYIDKKINSVPVFGNKYWMGYGRNYFLMFSVRF